MFYTLYPLPHIIYVSVLTSFLQALRLLWEFPLSGLGPIRVILEMTFIVV